MGNIFRVLYWQRVKAGSVFEPLLRLEVLVVLFLEVPC